MVKRNCNKAQEVIAEEVSKRAAQAKFRYKTPEAGA